MDPHGSTELFVEQGATPSPVNGYMQSTIPAGQTQVAVELAPTDTCWTDGNGVLAGDADTPIQLNLVHPSAVGVPDDLEAYDSLTPSVIDVMKTTTNHVMWWQWNRDNSAWKESTAGVLSISGTTDIDLKWKINISTNVPAIPWTGTTTRHDGLPNPQYFAMVPPKGTLDAAHSDDAFIKQTGAGNPGDSGDVVITVLGRDYLYDITMVI